MRSIPATSRFRPVNAAFVPSWMPFGPAFWVIFTGMAFVLAGIAVLVRTADALAAQLTGVMFLVFSATALLRGLPGSHDESSWGGNAYNIVAAASAWIVGSYLAARKQLVARA